MKLIYQKFSCISVLSQAELGMQLKTQLNRDQNCIFTEWNELDVRSAMFGMAEFWVSDFESINVIEFEVTWLAFKRLISLMNRFNMFGIYVFVLFEQICHNISGANLARVLRVL